MKAARSNHMLPIPPTGRRDPQHRRFSILFSMDHSWYAETPATATSASDAGATQAYKNVVASSQVDCVTWVFSRHLAGLRSPCCHIALCWPSRGMKCLHMPHPSTFGGMHWGQCAVKGVTSVPQNENIVGSLSKVIIHSKRLYLASFFLYVQTHSIAQTVPGSTSGSKHENRTSPSGCFLIWYKNACVCVINVPSAIANGT